MTRSATEVASYDDEGRLRGLGTVGFGRLGVGWRDGSEMVRGCAK
jgi:hypothetical protein